MLYYYVIVILSFLAIILIYFGYTKILSAPLIHSADTGLKTFLSVKELGKLEGSIENLSEIIIIADRIEEPTNELYLSVKENLKKGVKYTFLISGSKYDSELNSYIKIFQAIAEVIKRKFNTADLIEIHPISFDWNNYPYIFYRYIESLSGSPKIFAYMGTQLKEGIAEEYELMPPTIALQMFNLATQNAFVPNLTTINPDELSNPDPKIIPFNIHQKSSKLQHKSSLN